MQQIRTYILQVRGKTRLIADCPLWRPGFKSMSWDLWWTKRHWGRFSLHMLVSSANHQNDCFIHSSSCGTGTTGHASGLSLPYLLSNCIHFILFILKINTVWYKICQLIYKIYR
jgi:hypothetical protein